MSVQNYQLHELFQSLLDFQDTGAGADNARNEDLSALQEMLALTQELRLLGQKEMPDAAASLQRAKERVLHAAVLLEAPSRPSGPRVQLDSLWRRLQSVFLPKRAWAPALAFLLLIFVLFGGVLLASGANGAVQEVATLIKTHFLAQDEAAPVQPQPLEQIAISDLTPTSSAANAAVAQAVEPSPTRTQKTVVAPPPAGASTPVRSPVAPATRLPTLNNHQAKPVTAIAQAVATPQPKKTAAKKPQKKATKKPVKKANATKKPAKKPAKKSAATSIASSKNKKKKATPKSKPKVAKKTTPTPKPSDGVAAAALGSARKYKTITGVITRIRKSGGKVVMIRVRNKAIYLNSKTIVRGKLAVGRTVTARTYVKNKRTYAASIVVK